MYSLTSGTTTLTKIDNKSGNRLPTPSLGNRHWIGGTNGDVNFQNCRWIAGSIPGAEAPE